ncbi:MAG: sulfurtransferase TusA family protein [Proteobacteria bacterium]|nr:sulfurtransferase TusA family protein [Pseudomonadota bacterium]
MTNENPVAILDFCGMTCPAPLIGAKRVIDDIDPGQTLVLISDCPGTADDLAAWAKATGNSLVQTEQREGGRTAFTLRKGGGGTKRQVNLTLDIRGVSCPGPILEAKKLLDTMQPGEILLLISNCPGTPGDVRAWAKGGSISLEAAVESGRGCHEFYLKKN